MPTLRRKCWGCKCTKQAILAKMSPDSTGFQSFTILISFDLKSTIEGTASETWIPEAVREMSPEGSGEGEVTETNIPNEGGDQMAELCRKLALEVGRLKWGMRFEKFL